MVACGVDLVDIDKIKKVISKYEKFFLSKAFTDDEVSYCEAKSNRFRHYGARFAAKEAFLKALGTGFTNHEELLQVSVSKVVSGCPAIQLSENMKSKLEKRGFKNCSLSISHENRFAIANVILY